MQFDEALVLGDLASSGSNSQAAASLRRSTQLGFGTYRPGGRGTCDVLGVPWPLASSSSSSSSS